MTKFSDKVEYRNESGQLHRLDGPAIIWNDGDKEWYINGKLHRTDGPAVEYPNGSKTWHQHGNLHRLDGPAIEWANGNRAWWINGNKLTEETFQIYKFVNKL